MLQLFVVLLAFHFALPAAQDEEFLTGPDRYVSRPKHPPDRLTERFASMCVASRLLSERDFANRFSGRFRAAPAGPPSAYPRFRRFCARHASRPSYLGPTRSCRRVCPPPATEVFP